MRAAGLVGREDERAALVAVVEAARAGRGEALFVVGEAGIGKSALVRDALAGVGGVLSGRASPPPSPPLRPLVELALAAVSLGARVDDDRLRIHRVSLATLLPGAVVAPTGADGPTPLHLGEAVLSLCRLAVRPGPPVLVVEDLHWADDESRAALEHIAERLHATPVTLVVTLRPEGTGADLAERLEVRRAARVLRLGPLGPVEVAALVASCLGADPPAGLLEALGVAEGRPLLVEELLATLYQRGSLAGSGREWRFVPGATPTVPARVEAMVAERLGALDEVAQRVLLAAALVGRDVDVVLLGPQAERGLRSAAAAGLLAPDPSTGRLRFSHALVREAVLAEAAGSPRLAQSAAELLARIEERLGGRERPPEVADLELAARLAEATGNPARAAELLHEAGGVALARGLPATAARLLERAAELAPPGGAALAVRESLVRALAAAGDATRAAAEGRSVHRQLAALGADLDRVVACTVAVARAQVNAGRWDDAWSLLEPSITAGPPPAEVGALGALVALARHEFDAAEGLARGVLEQGLEVAAPPRCEAAEVLGRLARRRDLDEARNWFDVAAGLADHYGLELWRARALHELATIDQLRTLDVAGLGSARDAAVAAAAPGLVNAVDFHLSAVHGVRFEPGPSLEAARRCLDTARRLGAAGQEAWAWTLIAGAHAVAGDTERARSAVAEAIRLAPADPEVGGTATGLGLGLPALLGGDRDSARRRWMESIALLRSLPEPTPLPPWYLWPLLATVDDLEGDGGARARAETDVPALRLATGPDALWLLAAAAAAGRAGDRQAADALCGQAAARFLTVPAFAGYRHLGHLVAAEAALAGGWGDPGHWMAEAGDWFAARGFAGVAAAANALARRAGVPQRRRGRGDSDVPAALATLGVTSREVDVLNLVAAGLTNPEIAARLYLSVRTVKGHVESLLAKTGAANRTQLAGLTGPARPGPPFSTATPG